MSDADLKNGEATGVSTEVDLGLVSLDVNSNTNFDMTGFQLHITINSINATRDDVWNKFLQELKADCPVQNGIYVTNINSINNTIENIVPKVMKAKEEPSNDQRGASISNGKILSV